VGAKDTRVEWVEIVSRPRKPAPEEVLMRWARELAKEGVKTDWQKLLPPRGFVVLPRRWVVERTFTWIEKNRRMSKDYERLTATSEAFIYVAMSRLMVRRLARAQLFLDSFGRRILRSWASALRF
jgi:Transposase DDE domain